MVAATPVSLILGVKERQKRHRHTHFHPPGSMKDPLNAAWRDDFWKKRQKKGM